MRAVVLSVRQPVSRWLGGDVDQRTMIRAAVAATRAVWPEVPDLGMVTFVDASRVRSARPGRNGRRRGPGYSYVKAGFRQVGMTNKGLLVFQMLPSEMPEASPASASLRTTGGR